MKSLASSLLIGSLLVACQNESKLDSPQGEIGTGSLEERVRKLEADNKKYHDELEWLNGIYKQQKAQQDQQEANEPALDATFAVDIAASVKAGQVEGPPTACVTLVEAWDFA